MRLSLCDQPWRRRRWLCRQPYRHVSRPTPGDVVDKHGSSTSDYTETHRLGGERQRSIHYHFINDRLFLVDGDSNADVRTHLRGGRSSICDAVCEGRKPVRDGDRSFTYRMIRDRVSQAVHLSGEFPYKAVRFDIFCHDDSYRPAHVVVEPLATANFG